MQRKTKGIPAMLSGCGTCLAQRRSGTITGGTCFGNVTIDPSTLLIGDGSTLVLDDAAPPATGKAVLTGNFFGPSPVGFGAGPGTYTSNEGSCSETGTVPLSQ